ncbi:hypothetical protein K1719_019411 [Acacia pycnantha]|nr:hypothetical protein K1719_019411 [Acacia pycnantha]
MFRSTYLDDGDACHECQVCGAEMWFAERLKGVKKNEMPQFGIFCCNGKIIVPLLRRPPKELEELFFNKHSMQSNFFLKNIRTYNNMFCFTSMGGRIDHSINSRGGGPYYHHFIGSLLPPQGNPPVYAQLYIYDTENEISNRMSTARSELNQVNEEEVETSVILHGNKLRNSFIVDGYSMVESDRLDYIRKHQKELRVDLYSGITDALTRGETDPSSTGDELFYHLLSQWRTIHDSKLSRCYGHLCMGWRDDGHMVSRKGVKLDNRSVVPYNATLLKLFGGHLNIEKTNQSRAIKYLFKYISKGNDRVIAGIYNKNDQPGSQQSFDEISHYLNCRYVSSCEASWRIFGFDIHHRHPPVERLSFHLPQQQSIYYKEGETMSSLVNNPRVKESMFLACNTTLNVVYREVF